jgi:ABC-type Mn2+/Zn2+ transport system permease subunit
MFVLAPILGVASVLAGLVLSYALDLPSGPAIVVISGLGFGAAWGWRAHRDGPARRGERPGAR